MGLTQYLLRVSRVEEEERKRLSSIHFVIDFVNALGMDYYVFQNETDKANVLQYTTTFDIYNMSFNEKALCEKLNIPEDPKPIITIINQDTFRILGHDKTFRIKDHEDCINRRNRTLSIAKVECVETWNDNLNLSKEMKKLWLQKTGEGLLDECYIPIDAEMAMVIDKNTSTVFKMNQLLPDDSSSCFYVEYF